MTTAPGTCRTAAVAVASVRGAADTPGATVMLLVTVATPAAIVTTLAQVGTGRGLLPVEVVIVMV